MSKKLIIPAALLVLAACGASPTAVTPRAARLDANPGIGSGAGLLPSPDETGGQLGSGNRPETSGNMGSGYDVDAAPGIGSGVGLLPSGAGPDLSLDASPAPGNGAGEVPPPPPADAPRLGSGADQGDNGYYGSGY